MQFSNSLMLSPIQVNGVSVVNATHEYAVNLIRTVGDTLTMLVVEGRSSPYTTNHPIEQTNIDNAQSTSRTAATGSSFKPGVN